LNLERPLKDPRVTFVQADIADRDAMTRVFRDHRPSAVLNLAAETHVDRSIDSPRPFVDTNVTGTLVLLDAARGHAATLDAPARDAFRFLHVSTDEVYGTLGPTGLFSEETAYAPNSPYAASKAAADHLVRAYFHTYGLPILITNCSNNYGPFQFPEKLIPLMILNALDGRPLPIYGDGANVRDWLHVDDHCLGIQLALEKGRPGEVYNIGGGTELTNRELTERLLAACGKDWSSVRQVTDRKGHDRRYSLDISKISSELGYAPQVDLDTGLAATVRWYTDNRAWWEPLKARAELGN
jgi:dTDP-glucose 4,6-dehydratase